jgi:putative hydrolase of the HAD superfamily
MRFADLDAVTLDAFGTLISLADPVPALVTLLESHGAAREPGVVRRAVEAEARYYRAHALTGRDPATLAALRRRCAAVFLQAAEAAQVDPAEFVTPFVAALRFQIVPAAAEALENLRARGLSLAVVSNWDYELPARLREVGLAPLFSTVVTSAEAGVEKPDPKIFGVALDRLGVAADRTLHVGDGDADSAGARAARLRFEWAPLADVVDR